MTSDNEQRIPERTYQIWEQEGRPEGRDKINWDQAVLELQGEQDRKSLEELRNQPIPS